MLYSNWHNKATIIWLGVLTVAALVLGSWWWQNKIHIQSDIFSLLPKEQQSAGVSEAQDHINQWLNRQLFVMVSAPTLEGLQQHSQSVLKHFEAAPDLWHLPEQTLDTQGLGQQLFAHKTGLLSASDQALLQAGDYAALTDASLMQLISPAMPIGPELLQQDPLLLFPRYAMGLQDASQSHIQWQDGFPTVEQDGRFYRLINIHLQKSPFDIDYQTQTADWLKSLQTQATVDSHIDVTGTLVYASAGTQSAKQEMSTIGLGSTLGVILLVWLGFKSFRPLVTEFAAVTSGCLMAFLVTHTLFGEVHLMTMVFGASLIGASVDFSFYYLFMQTHERHRHTGSQVMQHMLPGLFIGLLTTLAAYVFLLLTPFPGLRQIAVFSMTGLSAAWLTSMLLLPRLKALDTDLAVRKLRFLSQWRHAFLNRPRWRLILVVVTVIFAIVCAPLWQSNDDVRHLQAINPHWQQQEAAIKQVFGQQHTAQYFVVQGDNEAQTAQREAALLEALSQHPQYLAGFQALGKILPSPERLQDNIDLIKAIPNEVLEHYAQQVGLPQENILAWQTHLPKASLNVTHLRNHPAFQLRINDKSRIVLLNEVKNPAALQALAQGLNGVTWVNPTENLSAIFQHYRQQSTWRLVLAGLILAVALGFLYGHRAIFDLMAPVTLALVTTFSLQAALGMQINLFNIMAAFLVLGIGVDYAIFYRHTEAQTPVVAYALFLCMVAAILGFGLLSLSQTQAIQSFGCTVLLGVFCSYAYTNLLTASAPVDSSKEKNA